MAMASMPVVAQLGDEPLDEREVGRLVDRAVGEHPLVDVEPQVARHERRGHVEERGRRGRSAARVRSRYASRRPAVVSSAVGAPLRSMIALVTSVVPCTIPPTSPIGMPFASSVSCRIVSIARAGSCGVVRVLPTATSPCSPTTQRSVNVPPMSTPTCSVKRAVRPWGTGRGRTSRSAAGAAGRGRHRPRRCSIR